MAFHLRRIDSADTRRADASGTKQGKKVARPGARRAKAVRLVVLRRGADEGGDDQGGVLCGGRRVRVERRRWGCGIFLASGGGGNVAPSVQRMNATLHYLTDQTGQKPPTFCRSPRVPSLACADGGFVFLHGDNRDGGDDNGGGDEGARTDGFVEEQPTEEDGDDGIHVSIRGYAGGRAVFH